MDIAELHFSTQPDETMFAEGTDPAELAHCVALLGDEERYALRRYLNQLIWEECAPLAERVARVPSFAELDERRAERRMRRQSAARAETSQSPQADMAESGPDAA